MTHICVSKLTVIGSDNSLSPDRPQAIIWTKAGILLIGPLGTNFSEILIEILTFSFKKMRMKVWSAKRQPFCLGLNVLSMRGGSWNHTSFNTLRPRLNGQDFADDISSAFSKCILSRPVPSVPLSVWLIVKVVVGSCSFDASHRRSTVLL